MKSPRLAPLFILLLGLAPLIHGAPADGSNGASSSVGNGAQALPGDLVLGQSGAYADVNGVKLYYEVHGEGEPLLLIHGDMMPMELWAGILPELMTRYRVIVPERRGHFRSFDTPAAYTYQLFADDGIALLDALDVESAVVVGYSGGAVTGLIMAAQHPGRVSKLVLWSGLFSSTGLTYEEYRTVMSGGSSQSEEAEQFLASLWRRLSPMGPDYYETFYQKINTAIAGSPYLTPRDLATTDIPVLTIGADRDIIRFDHFVTMFESFPEHPDASVDIRTRQFGLVPGATHLMVFEKPEVVLQMTLEFLLGTAAEETTVTDYPAAYVMPGGKILGRSGSYIEVNGVKLYVEEYGEGEPLLLLHGNYAPVETWIDTIPALLANFRVIVPERRGHYRSFDTSEPFSYELWADDMVALLDVLGIRRAAVIGHSGGAMTALTMALRHPERVTRVVGLSSWFSEVGSTYDSWRDWLVTDPEGGTLFPAEALAFWRQVNPMGSDYLPTFIEKMQNMALTLVPADLAAITAPLLVVSGDRDWMRFDHTFTLFDSVGKASDPEIDIQNRQLAIIPGTTHMMPYEKPELVNRIMLDFLLAK